MFFNKMETMTHYKCTTDKNAYGEDVLNYEEAGNVSIAIFYNDTSYVNNPKYFEVTHIGLTREKDFAIKDKVGKYEILEVNPQGNITQLMLKAVN